MSLMMDTLDGTLGLLAQPEIWIAAAVGLLFGIIAGALPGLGTTLAYALVLPFTFPLEITVAIVLLMAITVGVQYGNSIPAILVGVPGTPAAVLTVLDGFALHKRGESGLALGLALVGAVAGQIVSTFFFIAAVVPLAVIAYLFLNPEIFALHVLGIVAIISLTGKNIVKGFMAAILGLMIAFIGLDPVNFQPRFTFDIPVLRNGVSVTVAVIGILAVSELFRQSRQSFQWASGSQRVTALFPRLSQVLRAGPAILGGTVVGTIIGAIPGAGATPAAMISYQQAQLISKRPEEFGKGSIEGLAANESSQNASSAGELIPTLGFGIPGSGSMVLLLAALTLNGFIPGPNMINTAPQLLHAVVAGLLGASILLAIVGWPMARFMLRMLTINRSVVIVLSLAVVTLGVYSLNYRVVDVFICMLFGALGYFMLRYGYSVAAAALAIVLAAGLESSLRRGLSLFSGAEFITRPITIVVLLVSLGFLIAGLKRTLAMARRERHLIETGEDDPALTGDEVRDLDEYLVEE